MTTQPPPNAIRMASEHLTAIANLIERPPLDDVELTQSVATQLAAAIRTVLSAINAGPLFASDAMVRITREQYPEIIQAARWMDEDNGTDHFEPGTGFIVDDPDGLTIPTRWVEHLPTIEAALAGLDHERPHPEDVDTLEWLAREDKEPTLYDSAAYCFVSGEHRPMTAMANSSRDLWIASVFFNERFESWTFDPAAGFPAPVVAASGYVLVPAIATREMVDAADACTDAYSAYAAMVEVARVR